MFLISDYDKYLVASENGISFKWDSPKWVTEAIDKINEEYKAVYGLDLIKKEVKP